MQVDVILPAAGSGERMKLSTPKQFVKVLGKPVLAYTIDCFHRLSWIRHIVVVVSEERVEFTRDLIQSYGFYRVRVCVGSFTRHRSIHCGIKALQGECEDSDVVVIHDAARPLTPEDVIVQVTTAAKAHGAAGVTRPLVSTVIRGGQDGHLMESLDRRCFQNSEMPQAFQYGIISSAYEKCSTEELDHGTECLLLALTHAHCPAMLVEGSDQLWKVSYEKDLYSLESAIKAHQTEISIVDMCDIRCLELPKLLDKLHLRGVKVVKSEEHPANTFVICFDTATEQEVMDRLAQSVSQLYLALSDWATRMDLMVVMVCVPSDPCDKSCSDARVSIPHAKTHVDSDGLDCEEEDECRSGKSDCSKTKVDERRDADFIEVGADSSTTRIDGDCANNIKTNRSGSKRTRNHFTADNDGVDNKFKCGSEECKGAVSDGVRNISSLQPELPLEHGSDIQAICGRHVARMRQRLRSEASLVSIVIGVSCSVRRVGWSEVVDQLIWQRSPCLDGQTLVLGSPS